MRFKAGDKVQQICESEVGVEFTVNSDKVYIVRELPNGCRYLEDHENPEKQYAHGFDERRFELVAGKNEAENCLNEDVYHIICEGNFPEYTKDHAIQLAREIAEKNANLGIRVVKAVKRIKAVVPPAEIVIEDF